MKKNKLPILNFLCAVACRTVSQREKGLSGLPHIPRKRSLNSSSLEGFRMPNIWQRYNETAGVVFCDIIENQTC